ncbi:MAG TPA: tetratricopeptide repeat protein, partial [Acidobacteriota bacterium]|nr:tetratricopeptide repeat protein [Acidobacteriota bacterium]
GRWRVQAASADLCPPDEADFEIVPFDAGTTEQRMLLDYVNARVAVARGDTAEALRLAQEAVSLGPPLHMNVMFSYRLLGDLYYDSGQRQAALEAYQQAVAIAQTAFPKSRIPYILESRIQELEQE